MTGAYPGDRRVSDTLTPRIGTSGKRLTEGNV
jgi:hypothetical protein